jgi:hypothetical protein
VRLGLTLEALHFIRQRHSAGAINLVAVQPEFGWSVRRKKQWNTASQQHGDKSHCDGVYLAEIQKGAEEFATARQPNIFAAPSLQLSNSIRIQFGDDGHFRMVWLLHGPREDDGGDSCERRLAQSLAGGLIGSPAHQQSVDLRPDRGEINFRVEANPAGFSVRASNITIPRSSPLHSEFSAST